MQNKHVEGAQRDSRPRGARHALLSFSGGALVGFGLVLSPATSSFTWILVFVGVAVALTGAVWSGRVAQVDAHPWSPSTSYNAREISPLREDAHNDMR